METVIKNSFIEIKWNKSSAFMETTWTTTPLMSQKKYRELLALYIQQIEEYQPDKLIVDSREAAYVIEPEDQDWLNENIYPRTVKAGVKKLAFVVGTDVFMQISLEQVSTDSHNNADVASKLKQEFFDDYQQASDWVMAS